MYNMCIPGQEPWLHGLDSELVDSSTAHSEPPCRGIGLSQALVRL